MPLHPYKPWPVGMGSWFSMFCYNHHRVSSVIKAHLLVMYPNSTSIPRPWILLSDKMKWENAYLTILFYDNSPTKLYMACLHLFTPICIISVQYQHCMSTGKKTLYVHPNHVLWFPVLSVFIQQQNRLLNHCLLPTIKSPSINNTSTCDL